MTDGSKDDLLVAALAAGQSYRQAAEATGVGLTTVAKRMKDPAFRARVRSVRADIFDQVTGALVAHVLDAAAALHLIITGDEPTPVRLRAAVAILDLGLKYYQAIDLETRLRKLEEHTGIVPPRGGGGADEDGGPAA